MLLKNLLARILPQPGANETKPPKYSPEVGATGLLVEAAYREGAFTADERAIVLDTVTSVLGVSPGEAETFLGEVEQVQREQFSAMGFAASANLLPMEKKRALVKAMWKSTSSDGNVNIHESMLISTVGQVFEFDRDTLQALAAEAKLG